MLNDHEKNKLAADIAGVEVIEHVTGEIVIWYIVGGNWTEWNPLSDMYQAMQLVEAVITDPRISFELKVYKTKYGNHVRATFWSGKSVQLGTGHIPARAIVEAAHKAMEKNDEPTTKGT